MKITSGLFTLCVLEFALQMVCQRPPEVRSTAIDPGIDISTIPLGPSVTNQQDEPVLTVFAPQAGRSNGTAVIVAPGGAYRGLASNLEGRQVADWFAARGVTAFVLKYRLGEQNLYPIPLQDAQRAIRVVRASADTFGISPHRIGIIGFSAGGHLAAMAGTSFDTGHENASDPVERVSDRPDFLILGYPWLNAMSVEDRSHITYCSVLKAIPRDLCGEFEQKYTPVDHIGKDTPSTFIYMTSDDEAVPADWSVRFYLALRTAGVEAELHVFRHGAHGSGLGSGDPTLDSWPMLLEHWLRDQGYLSHN